ncbi:helicase associated domain-containing protein [Streptomyces sp. NPDC049813]|uniref:helicase associated domain-containing protein n=1 Tax=Streptomyces sp. NPDC049813 TaxID=3365597 RepID=UPI00378AFD6B
MSARARELLKFSSPRDPAELAWSVRLRILESEGARWRRGIEAAARYVKERAGGPLNVPYGFVTPEDWSPAGFPLGVRLTHQRRSYKAGRLVPERVGELDGLGLVWAPREDAFTDGLTAARAWAAAHGHFLPPRPRCGRSTRSGSGPRTCATPPASPTGSARGGKPGNLPGRRPGR